MADTLFLKLSEELGEPSYPSFRSLYGVPGSVRGAELSCRFCVVRRVELSFPTGNPYWETADL